MESNGKRWPVHYRSDNYSRLSSRHLCKKVVIAYGKLRHWVKSLVKKPIAQVEAVRGVIVAVIPSPIFSMKRTVIVMDGDEIVMVTGKELRYLKKGDNVSVIGERGHNYSNGRLVKNCKLIERKRH